MGANQHPIGYIREQTFDHDGVGHDLLYAANNSQHADAPTTRFGLDEGDLDYNLEQGWYVGDASKLIHSNPMISFLRVNCGPRSSLRTTAFHKYAMQATGEIDIEWTQALYRTPAIGYPEAHEIETAIPDLMVGKRGVDLAGVGVRNAAFTATMEPDAGDQGLYSGCVGPLNYDVVALGGHGFYYYDEGNVAWTIRLAATPEELVVDARDRARADIVTASNASSLHAEKGPVASTLDRFIAEAKGALEFGESILNDEADAAPNREAARLSRALRRFTRAQVRARQVVEALEPPATLPNPL